MAKHFTQRNATYAELFAEIDRSIARLSRDATRWPTRLANLAKERDALELDRKAKGKRANAPRALHKLEPAARAMIQEAGVVVV